LIWFVTIAALLVFAVVSLLAGYGTLIWLRKREARQLHGNLRHFPNKKSKWTQVAGGRIHYIAAGHGSDLVLLHGIAANIYCWRKVIPLLTPHFRVWTLDLLGFGHSDKPVNGKYDAPSQAEAILEFMNAVGISKKAILVGSSMGASIATQLTADHPDAVSHLILCNAAINRNAVVFDLRRMKRLAPAFAPFVNRFTVRQILRYIAAPGAVINNQDVDAYLKPYSKNYDGIISFIASFDILLDKNLWTRTKDIKIPTLLLWGEKDNVVPAKLAIELEKSFPNCQLKVHPGSGHHIQEEAPEWFVENLIHFLSPK